MGIKTIKMRVANTMYVYVGRDADMGKLIAKRDRAARSALSKGEMVTYDPGTEQESSEWETIDPVINVAKEGSAQYTWDKTGNKVKCIKRVMRRWGDKPAFETVSRHVVYKDIFKAED